MKKNLFMLAAVALMSFTACNKEEVSVENPVDNQTPATVVEFTASFATTKTTLDTEGSKTLWVESDRIDINGQEFKIKELIDGGLSAKFENVNDLPGDFAAPFTATYPYGVTEVPAAQTAKAGTFDPAAVLETAESDDYTLSFKNVTSLLKFQVATACETVTITSSDALAGSSAKTVTVTGSFVTDETYYAAVLPGEKADFVVRMDGYLSRNAASVTVGESTIANMGTLPAPVKSDYALVGSHTSWGFSDLTPLYVEGNNYVAYNLSGLSEFKVVNKTAQGWENNLTTNKGIGSSILSSGVAVMTMFDGGNNVKVASSITRYNVIVSKDLSKITVMESELNGQETKYSICGSNGNWDSDIVLLTTSSENILVAKNITFVKDQGVKIRQDKAWGTTWSCDWKQLKVNEKMTCQKGYDCNMLFPDNSENWGKNYDMYVLLSGSPSSFILVTSGSDAPTFN